MKKTITLITTVAALAVPAAPALASTNYHNPTTLAAAIKRLANARQAREGSSLRITTISCIVTSSTAARCLAHVNNGARIEIGVTIAPNGDEFLTH